MPIPQQPVAELKAALGLTDPQVNLLLQNQRDRNLALRPIHDQIAERQRAFARAQESETNPTVIGNIVLDMVNLQKQIPEIEKRFDAQALAVLTADQRPKLKALEDAMKLQTAIYQGVSFGLLERPQRQVIGLPGMPGTPAMPRFRRQP